jgi:hypothetical protein
VVEEFLDGTGRVTGRPPGSTERERRYENYSAEVSSPKPWSNSPGSNLEVEVESKPLGKSKFYRQMKLKVKFLDPEKEVKQKNGTTIDSLLVFGVSPRSESEGFESS